ncbi:MAG TPA: radical SAM protein, partial [Desulfotomaculum sp.]|nr:radical SAM protein [Desulfotomaculum sp.]
MIEFKYIYGPVPSRRLGLSLGVSIIPKKACNYSCIYCQLGRTDRMTNTRQLFYPVGDIIEELDKVLQNNISFDVVTIVGEGEPTLYLGLGELIEEIHKRTDKPVAVITNGALLYELQV